MDGLTIEQQRKAVNFSVCFLRDEVESLRYTIESGLFNEDIKKQAVKRLSELERDLAVFEVLNDQFNI
jgi:hypothetical protein